MLSWQTEAKVHTATDWRLPVNRREAFMRSYQHSLRFANFPGCVYFALPYMAEALGWDTEQRYWAAWLNANTQNPVTTLLLMEAGSLPRYATQVARYQEQNFRELQWDLDRRHQKTSRVFAQALHGYTQIISGYGSQSAYWRGVQDWDDAWKRMTALPYMGRLSAWSGLEYMRLLGDQPIPDADNLLLEDTAGSRSHRNALALLHGDDHLLHDPQLNPGFSGKWAPDYVAELGQLGADLLAEAKDRTQAKGSAISKDFAEAKRTTPRVRTQAKTTTARELTQAIHATVQPSYLTLESGLCSFKSFFKKNRRYPNVYSDMMFDRLRWAEARHGDRFGVLWAARKEALPSYLRLEDTPADPGLKPVKQNWFRGTGEVPVLGHEPEWADMWSLFDQNVVDGKYGLCR
jgi:Alpha-glutamyl/putrescinyl thymine pyrophosphorylase clade 2